MTHWFVVTPPFGDYLTAVDDAPEDAVGLAVTVEAEDKEGALLAAWGTDEFDEWTDHCARVGLDPEAGLRIFDAKCEHGHCLCDKCNEACLICDADLLGEVEDGGDGGGPWYDGKGNEG